MLHVKRVDDGFELTVVTHGPVVYLDQWAWCDLAENTDLRKTLAIALREANAAVAYSFMTLAELSQVTRRSQQEAIADFADAVDYAFVDSDPNCVSQRESSTAGSLPCLDETLIKGFFAKQARGKSAPTLRMSEFLQYLRPSEMQSRMAAELAAVEQALDPLIRRARLHAGVVEAAKRRTRERHRVTSPTSVVMHLKDAAIDWILSQPRMKMGKNEWVDLFHMIVPVAYCHFVLLDRRWASFVANYVRLEPPLVARVYSKQAWDEFLRDLANVRMTRRSSGD